MVRLFEAMQEQRLTPIVIGDHSKRELGLIDVVKHIIQGSVSDLSDSRAVMTHAMQQPT